jgi:hypothetical protein
MKEILKTLLLFASLILWPVLFAGIVIGIDAITGKHLMTPPEAPPEVPSPPLLDLAGLTQRIEEWKRLTKASFPKMHVAESSFQAQDEQFAISNDEIIAKAERWVIDNWDQIAEDAIEAVLRPITDNSSDVLSDEWERQSDIYHEWIMYQYTSRSAHAESPKQ